MTRETATLVVSSLTAMALIGAAVTAQPARTTTEDRLTNLESDLRFQLELRWRSNRPIYFERAAAVDAVMDSWRQSRQSAGDSDTLADWLHGAMASSLPGESGVLPPAPKFGDVKPPAVQTAGESAASKAVTPKDTALPAVAARERASSIEVQPAPIVTAAKPVAPQLAVPIANRLDAQQGRVPEATNSAPPAERSIAVRKIVATAAPPKVEALPTKETTQEAAAIVEAPPNPVDELSNAAKPQAEPRALVAAQQVNTDAKSESKAGKGVTVNLAELNARIGGYHVGLDEVDAAIVAAQNGLSAAEAESLVARLEELTGQCQFVRLYYDALTKEERNGIAAPRSMKSTVELVSQQCAHVEDAGEEDVFKSAAGDAEGELAGRLRAIAEAIEK